MSFTDGLSVPINNADAAACGTAVDTNEKRLGHQGNRGSFVLRAAEKTAAIGRSYQGKKRLAMSAYQVSNPLK
jgi:hypothetical protein